MSNSVETLAKVKKANKLARLTMRKNGPKSFKRGQGALLNALLQAGGKTTQRELCATLDCSRSVLKDIVKKAVRNQYVTIEETEAEHTYYVVLTETGKELAEKRIAAHKTAVEEYMSCLSTEELAQLDAICEKMIIQAKEMGVCGKKKGYQMSSKNCCC